ncbi:MAG TPA: hypothetical protein VGI54_08275 [Solirubrobacteraceae bacterium]
MTALTNALTDAGGLDALPARHARLRALLLAALDRGTAELGKPRSGYGGHPVEVAIGAGEGGLLAVVPVDAAFRADPAVASDRGWAVLAAAVGALCEVADLGAPARAADLALTAAALGGHLAVHLPVRDPDAELAAVAFEEAVASVDRLKAAARAVPPGLLRPDDVLRPPIGADHPLRAAEAVARLGGAPADRASVEALEEAVLVVLAPDAERVAPHDDPDPARRVARRIVQRLAGMGKWGGYHTEWAHLARGFAGHDRELAYAVGERLLDAEILLEKPSVGQRHVFLNPRKASDVYALIERGSLPPGLSLP